MASNREERLQMRQRGAGTRKIKEVNFGFSLGLGPPIEQHAQPASQPTSSVPEPGTAPQPPSLDTHPPPSSETIVAPPPQTRPSPSPPRATPPSQEQAVQRTPGSARNKLPPRPSTFDIPADDQPEFGRSSKRRRIETSREISRSPIGTRSKSRSPNFSPNGVEQIPSISPRGEGTALPIRTNSASELGQVQDQEPPTHIPPIPTDKLNEQPSQTLDRAHEQLETAIPEQTTPQAELEPPRVNGTASPPSESNVKARRRGRGPAGASASLSQNGVSEPEPAGNNVPELTEHPGTTETTESPEKPEAPAEIERPTAQRAKRLRSRTPASERASSISPSNDAAQTEDANSEPSRQDDTAGKSVRGRKKKNREIPAKEPTAAEESVEPTPAQTEVESNTEPKDDTVANEPAASSHAEQPNGVDKGKNRAGRPRKRSAPSPEPAEETEEISRAGRRKRQREERIQEHQQQRKRERPRDPTPEQEEQPEVEAETEPQPEPEETKRTKRRRGRRPTKQPAADQPTLQVENAEEQPQPPKRKPRQPRGETVPITVHRLANPASLHGAPAQDDSSSEEESSPDELTNKHHQTTKLPNRGGVNPADVLAQICRETLEKTLTTLTTSIANEANAAKRAEWTLRRKAVEAFGTELDGRLFELSEMLDSNFMLGAKLRKAKRNMLDLRNRLDQVRREREAVALRMDAVRREHAMEEQARMARSTINHSLHNLDLALERGHTRNTNEDSREEVQPLTAGLEFRLRNIAQNASSTAPGAQGGLLNQMRMFNAQLEAAARQLERN